MASDVAAKLLIKPGSSLWLSDPSRAGELGSLPDGVTISPGLAGAQVAVIFADSAQQLRALADAHAAELLKSPVLWIVYPKGNRADINRDSLWHLMAGYKVRPITQVAVNEALSALRFRPLKPGE